MGWNANWDITYFNSEMKKTVWHVRFESDIKAQLKTYLICFYCLSQCANTKGPSSSFLQVGPVYCTYLLLVCRLALFIHDQQCAADGIDEWENVGSWLKLFLVGPKKEIWPKLHLGTGVVVGCGWYKCGMCLVVVLVVVVSLYCTFINQGYINSTS